MEICERTGLSKSMLSRFMSGSMGLGVKWINAIGEVLKLRIVSDAAGDRLEPTGRTPAAPRTKSRRGIKP
jgi:hypothetical protein